MDVTPIDSVLKGRPSIVVPGGQLSMPLPPKNLEEKNLIVLRQINPHVHIQIKVIHLAKEKTSKTEVLQMPSAIEVHLVQVFFPVFLKFIQNVMKILELSNFVENY